MMGGWRYGAGRPAFHNKIESFRSIDVRRWAREGELTPHSCFARQWIHDGEEVASIAVVVDSPERLTLKYLCAIDGSERQHVSFPITLTYTACPFGGERVWFVCPHSGRRVAKLYFYRGRWYCRKSLRLKYQSQSDDFVTRLHRRIEKIEAILSDSDKIKRMHWKTFNRLVEKQEHFESLLDWGFYQRAVAMMGH